MEINVRSLRLNLAQFISFRTDDLRHLTAVRSTQHSKFADENGMAAFLLSAKNGDQVKHAFWKISASLAGIPIVKFEQEGHAVVVPATILDYKR